MFFKFLEDISPFCGANDIPVLECLIWVSKPEWAALLALGGIVHVTCSLRFTSGVTPADLLVASMAVEGLSSMYLQAGIGRAQTHDLSCCGSQCDTRQILYLLSHARMTLKWYFLSFLLQEVFLSLGSCHFQWYPVEPAPFP